METQFRVRIVNDEVSQPELNGEDASTIAAFQNDYLSYVGVIVEELNRECPTCQRGPSWEILDSLWAVMLASDDPALPYLWEHAGSRPPFVLSADLAKGIPGYIGDIVRGMVSEVATS